MLGVIVSSMKHGMERSRVEGVEGVLRGPRLARTGSQQVSDLHIMSMYTSENCTTGRLVEGICKEGQDVGGGPN